MWYMDKKGYAVIHPTMEHVLMYIYICEYVDACVYITLQNIIRHI